MVHFTSSTIPLKNAGFLITKLTANIPPIEWPDMEYCGYFNHKIKWIGLKKIVITVNENWDSWKPGFEETTVSQYILLDLMV